jgi:ubiquitin C-terminal hydrolase
VQIECQTKQCGVLTPQRFIHAVKRADERFRSYMHQDAQEFLNFLLDTLLETVTALEKPATVNGGTSQGASQSSVEAKTFVHELFCGKTVSQTRCMNCESCSKREEQVMEFTL